ncbi:hypothetical protein AB1Y20_017258 [Prymnesium parvum]|uniref:Uncharacterized protein n=1 Tax=Prymnesium parvum TaxID=97485 RepID=A0AB34JNU2_PRYPA
MLQLPLLPLLALLPPFLPPFAHVAPRTCALPGVCCAGTGYRFDASLAPSPAVRDYLRAVYPTAAFRDDQQALSFFETRHWFYNLSVGSTHGLYPLWRRLPLVLPPRFRCTDGFFGSGLMHLDLASRFPEILPCSPGRECVQRQFANMPACAAQVAALGADVWVEVWHLAFNGRMSRRRPTSWAEFADEGSSPWWYIYAPGSGVFYHAGTTLAAPSKASMIASLLERWAAAGAALKRAAPAEILKLVPPTTAEMLALASKLRAVANGTECSHFGWGRWRCYADRIPNDTAWDSLMLALGRALRFDSLFFTGLMWGRAVAGQPAPAVPPSARGPYRTVNIDATTELVDLRVPSSLPSSQVDREVNIQAWAAELLRTGRLSLRDPLAPSDSSRALPCNFNYSGYPTMRLACGGVHHPSWMVRHETQHQQGCTDLHTAKI